MTIATGDGGSANLTETPPGKSGGRPTASGPAVWRAGTPGRTAVASTAMMVLLLSAVCFPVVLRGQSEAEFRPLSGKQLRDRLQKRISVSWSSAELGETLLRFSRNQQVALFLDRRVDPGQKIEFRAEDTSVEQLIFQIGDATGCGVCWLGDIAYFGPRQAVAELWLLREGLLERIGRLPTAAKRRLLAQRPWRWQRLTEPARLLESLLAGSGVRSPGSVEQIPHDLWPRYSLPAARFVDRLILVTYGFERWLEWDGTDSLRLIGVPEIESAETRIRVSSRSRSRILAQLKHEFPEAGLRADRNHLVGRGDPATLYEIRRMVARLESSDDAAAQGNRGSGTQVFTIRSTQAIGTILKTAAAKLEVELKYDAKLRDQLLRRIDLDVTQVTCEELIEVALQGTGLGYSLGNGVLLIHRQDP